MRVVVHVVVIPYELHTIFWDMVPRCRQKVTISTIVHSSHITKKIVIFHWHCPHFYLHEYHNRVYIQEFVQGGGQTGVCPGFDAIQSTCETSGYAHFH